MSDQKLIVGRFNKDGKFITKDGAKTLRLSTENVDSHTDHFLSDEAKLGNYAVISGVETKTLIKDAKIVNVLDTIPSQLLAKLLESKDNESDKSRASRVGKLSDRILDELPEILGIDLSKLNEDKLDDKTKDIIPLKKHICAVVVGHSEKDKGAQSKFSDKTQEWDYNSVIAALIQKKATKVAIEIVFRTKGYYALPSQINALEPNSILSLHCNSSASGAAGTEMIHCPGSKKGVEFGEYIYDEVCKVFERTPGRGNGMRGVRTPYNGRGMNLLTKTKAPAIIAEPFFLSNAKDMKMGLERMDELAEAYVKGIEGYAASLAPITKPVEPPIIVKNSKLEHQGMGKQQFLRINDIQIEKMRKSSNTWANKTFGAASVELTKADIYIISNGEMGLKRGKVDINHRHSEGEIGLFPLPENLHFWLDTKKTKRHTPDWNKPHSVEKNVQAFFDYMVSLKNKHVKKASGINLYEGLFRIEGIQHDKIKGAIMLACVVHGYFYSGTYKDKKVPIKHIIKGLKNGDPITKIMKNTTYVHANSSILEGREENINDAIGWLG